MDGELAGHKIQRRINGLIDDVAIEPASEEHFKVFTSDLQGDDCSMLDLATAQGRGLLAHFLEDPGILIIDKQCYLLRQGLGENETESCTSVQNWLLRLRLNGLSVISIHHNGKNSCRQEGGIVDAGQALMNIAETKSKRPMGLLRKGSSCRQ